MLGTMAAAGAGVTGFSYLCYLCCGKRRKAVNESREGESDKELHAVSCSPSYNELNVTASTEAHQALLDKTGEDTTQDEFTRIFVYVFIANETQPDKWFNYLHKIFLSGGYVLYADEYKNEIGAALVRFIPQVRPQLCCCTGRISHAVSHFLRLAEINGTRSATRKFLAISVALTHFQLANRLVLEVQQKKPFVLILTSNAEVYGKLDPLGLLDFPLDLEVQGVLGYFRQNFEVETHLVEGGATGSNWLVDRLVRGNLPGAERTLSKLSLQPSLTTLGHVEFANYCNEPNAYPTTTNNNL